MTFRTEDSGGFVDLHHRSDCYRLERPVAGRVCFPLKNNTFSRRTASSPATRGLQRWLANGTLLVLALSCCLAAPAARASTGPAAPDVYEQVVRQYLDGKWDELNTTLKSHTRELSVLPAARKEDVAYIRKTIQECRPEWWDECKSGRLTRFRPVVWGRGIAAIFDPSAQVNLAIAYLGNSPTLTIKWDATAMDDPTIAGELEFSRGEHVDLDVWRGLGTGQSWGLIPPRSQLNLTESRKKQLNRYLSFRGNVAGAYYGTPRARRLALWEGISGWSHEYDKAGMYMPMRAIGIFFAAEVLGHPKTYPSVKWPLEPPAEGAESKMIWELQKWIRYHELPLPEDRALRDALKAFAATNEGRTYQSALVSLPNKLSLSLDPDADKPLCVQRDKWIKDQYAARPQRSSGKGE